MGIQKVSPEAIGTVPSCANCGSQRVVRAAWAAFNPDSGLYDLETVRDGSHCHVCDGDVQLVWSLAAEPGDTISIF